MVQGNKGGGRRLIVEGGQPIKAKPEAANKPAPTRSGPPNQNSGGKK